MLVPIDVGVVALACPITKAVVANCVVFVSAAAVAELALPLTANDPKVPTEVMFVCAAVVKVPTMLVPCKLPEVMFPVTAKLLSVPTEVMFV